MRELILGLLIITSIGLGYEIGTCNTLHDVQETVCSMATNIADYQPCIEKSWEDVKLHIEYNPKLPSLPKEEI